MNNHIAGIYFSGTGNTKYCVETFVRQFGKTCKSVAIEDKEVTERISECDVLVLGYPVYFSNAPKIMQDFISRNRSCFVGKRVFIIATMGLFSGDGAGCTARRLKMYGAEIIGGLHLKMPDSIGDEKVLKKTEKDKRRIIAAAEQKIISSAYKMKIGKADQEGLHFYNHVAGLLVQRLWFYGKSMRYHKKPVIHQEKCVGCGVCVQVCPMHNLEIENGTAHSHQRCTLCYRCFSHCPSKALTILGKTVYEQYLFKDYNVQIK